MTEEPTRVVMLKALVLNTQTGYPAHYKEVQACYGKRVNPAPEDGWWWLGATPSAARDIQRRGLHARGTLLTTFFPPQKGHEVEEGFIPDDVPPIDSDLFLSEIHLTTEERRAAAFQRKEAREAHDSRLS